LKGVWRQDSKCQCDMEGSNKYFVRSKKNKIMRYSANPALGSLKTRVSTNLNQCAIMKRTPLEILVFSRLIGEKENLWSLK